VGRGVAGRVWEGDAGWVVVRVAGWVEVVRWAEVGVAGIDMVTRAFPGGSSPGTQPPLCRPAGARHQPPRRLRPWRGLWTTPGTPPAGRLLSPPGAQAPLRRTRPSSAAQALTRKWWRARALVRRRGLETSSGPRTEEARRHPRRRCQTVQNHGQRPTHSLRRGQTRTHRNHDRNPIPTHRTHLRHQTQPSPRPTHQTRPTHSPPRGPTRTRLTSTHSRPTPARWGRSECLGQGWRGRERLRRRGWRG
jgi:hypothetical protein